MDSSDRTISEYDRLRGSLEGLALFTKPSTIKTVQPLTGRATTFVVETARAEDRGGDIIFVECMDENGVTRLALPPRVANVIAAQREALIARRRSRTAKRLAKERMARGEMPAFLVPKRKPA